MNQQYPFTVQPLPYPYDALEPYISMETLHFHHDKHYQTYVDKLNGALKLHPQLQTKSLSQLLENPEDIPEAARTAVLNNGGGVFNHALYFAEMTSPQSSVPSNRLTNDIIRTFGTFEDFKTKLSEAAVSVFGSGWAWLVKSKDNGGLEIIRTANQDVPDFNRYIPILLIDVWEHAYYLDYQNRRPDYIDNWFKLISWDSLNDAYEAYDA